MPLIPDPILDDIQARVDIAQLISRYVPLKRAGRHFKAQCPFHQERTPSFHVNTDKQIFHCFGCGVGGNVFGFVMQQEHLTFPEAVRRLAEETGVSLPRASEASRNGQTTKWLEVLEKACRYYERCLAHPQQGRAARAYLATRGVTERTRLAFRLGAAPNAWDRLVQAAKRSGLSQELLQQAGLITSGSRGPVDRFRHRVMFPILDVRGRVVGFGGRSLGSEEPKYLNSPDTPVYHKGQQLFGLFQAKDAIVQATCALVVEGYFDDTILWQAGLTHVVSPLGTAFTPEQANRLARYTDRVILAFDADAAGEAASLRGIDILVEAGLHVQVAQLPVGMDPDELVHRRGVEALRQLLTRSLTVVDFLIACAAKRYRLKDPEGKTRAAHFILPTIAKVPNAILRTEYVRLVAERLETDPQSVAHELRTIGARAVVPRQEPTPRTASAGAQRMLVALMVDEPARWNAVKHVPLLEHLQDARLKQLMAVVAELQASTATPPTSAQVLSRVTQDEVIGPLAAELVQLAQTVLAKERAFQECVQRVLSDARKAHLAQLREQLRTAQRAGNEPEVTRLLTAYQRLVSARSTTSSQVNPAPLPAAMG